MAAAFLPSPYKPTTAIVLLLLTGLWSFGAAAFLYWQQLSASHAPSAENPSPGSQMQIGEAFQPSAQGGRGGSGEIFGNDGRIIGGRGGRVGAGGQGRGGDGGGGVIHGNGGVIIGGEGGSVDGANIWFPPAQSGYASVMQEWTGQTPDFGVQLPGEGGATPGWLERQDVVKKIREDYFKANGQEEKIEASKVDDVPLDYINQQLEKRGYPWRARVERKHWYLYFVPGAPN